MLAISGERSAAHQDGYRRVERASGSFSRSLTLPEGVDGEAITASFDRGVLEIRVPKPEARKPRRIEIGSAKARAIERARAVARAAANVPPPCSSSAPRTQAPTPAPAR